MKDLSRLGRDLRRVLILDNSPASYVFHPDNAVSASWDAGRGLRSEKERGQSVGHLGLPPPGWAVSGPGVLHPPSFLIDLCLLTLYLVFWSILSVCGGPGSLLGIGAVVVFLGDSCDQLVGRRNNLVGPRWDFFKK